MTLTFLYFFFFDFNEKRCTFADEFARLLTLAVPTSVATLVDYKHNYCCPIKIGQQ